MSTPLIKATIADQLGAVQALLNNKVDINQQHIGTGRTALHYATRKGSLDLMTMLLHNGADPNIMDEYKMTPLLIAITRPIRTEELYTKISVLIKYGADTNIQGDTGRTPLHMAVIEDSLPLVKLLLDASDNPIPLINMTDYVGRNALLLAMCNGVNKEIIDLLCRYGTVSGVLHGLAYTHRFKEVKYLINNGHDPNEKNGIGITPLHIAIMGKNYEMMQVLIDNGADIHIPNNNGTTSLELAKGRGILIYDH